MSYFDDDIEDDEFDEPEQEDDFDNEFGGGDDYGGSEYGMVDDGDDEDDEEYDGDNEEDGDNEGEGKTNQATQGEGKGKSKDDKFNPAKPISFSDLMYKVDGKGPMLWRVARKDPSIRPLCSQANISFRMTMVKFSGSLSELIMPFAGLLSGKVPRYTLDPIGGVLETLESELFSPFTSFFKLALQTNQSLASVLTTIRNKTRKKMRSQIKDKK